MNRGEQYIPYSQGTETIASILQVIQQMQKGDPCEELAILYYKLGKMYHQINYYDQAVNAYSTSLHNFQMIKQSGIDVSLVQLQLGRTYYFLQAMDKAIQSVTLALSLFESDLIYITHQLDAYNVLGACYSAQNDLVQARYHYQSAICKALTYKFDNKVIAQPLSNLSNINWAEGNIEDAIKCCIAARNIRNSNELTQKLIGFYLSSGQYHAGLTEIRKYADHLLLIVGPNSLDYTDFLDKMFKNVLTAMKEVKDKAGRELIENILARHYKDQDQLLDYIREKLGRQKKKEVNPMEELD